MEDTTTTADKRIVEELQFGAKTAKRVGWEAWEFSVEAPHLVRVTNASYGFEKEDHSYLVGVDDRGDVVVPAECGCKADRFRDHYDCKHKVALATIGGPVVLQAAVDVESSAPALSVQERDDVTTVADKLQTDGGSVAVDADSDSCRHGDDRCDGPNGEGLPCFPCFEVGR
ncbi:SWIM zinc finger family protein [Halolamina sp. CBA1230]|uniref:SWIM zinc finger family protein n=1 Tax=Halolamina sp. CBA1230 TaxID=1853690 RepID=UPI0009A13C1D|nr:SWIM zinc finger family protein [Halolamina sp. CBA1230]QKY21197.1 SWIM zinc finger family protein [Halolamina sp. CBA1230]